MVSVFYIADYFLCLQDEDAEDYISNLKLQKLCYYAQGFYLALHGERLFKEDMEAWQHGPVIPCLYDKYKQHGSKCLPISNDFSFSNISQEICDLLNEVYSVYGQYSAWRLRDMTHMESPWIEARNKDKIISDSTMIRFFKERLA